MRLVSYYEYGPSKSGSYEKVWVGTATFHQFGLDYQDLDGGIGTFSTAIIELGDGTIKNVPVELVEFVK